MTSPFVVTGATGTVGRALVQTLTGHGVEVRAASRFPLPSTDPLVQPVRFDFTDSSTYPATFAGAESLFVVRPPDMARAVRDMAPALEQATRAGVRQVVLLSVQGADRLKVLPHAQLEQWLRGSGLAWTFLRPSFFDQNLITVHGPSIRDRNELSMPAGNGRTAFVDAHDVAAVAARAMLRPEQHLHRAWTLTGSEALTYGEVAAILTTVLGRSVRYTRPGLLAYVVQARRQQMPGGLIAATSVIYTTARLGLAAGRTDHVQQILGRPPTTLTAFLHRERAALEPTTTS